MIRTNQALEAKAYPFLSAYLDKPIVPGRALDVFFPAQVTQDVALFFVHGGGWRGGTRNDWHPIMQAFAAEGFVCGATDYRLQGVNILDQILDCRQGYDLFDSALTAEGRPRKILVYGGSAGAHLASLLSLAQPGECGEPLAFGRRTLHNPWVRPVGVILEAAPVTFEPWPDIFPPVWAGMEDIVGTPYRDRPDLYRKVSPITYVSAQMPPMLFLCAENEHMFPLEDTLRFIEKARQAGARAEHKLYTKAEHGFFYDVTRRQQQEAFADILTFIKSL